MYDVYMMHILWFERQTFLHILSKRGVDLEMESPRVPILGEGRNRITYWSQALSERPTSFLQCFDTVGLVIWPVKIIPDTTYNVFGATLNLA